jgi:hypothetical protein
MVPPFELPLRDCAFDDAPLCEFGFCELGFCAPGFV